MAHNPSQTLEGWSDAPEILHGDIVDKATLWSDMSVRFAAEGDGLNAVRAAWSSDICTIQAVSWEAVALADAHPEQMYFLIGTTVTQALALYAKDPGKPSDLFEVIQFARRGVAAAFEKDVLRLLRRRLRPIDHLHGMPVPTVDQIRAATQTRLEGMDPQTFIAQRRSVAAHHGELARAAHYSGNPRKALEEMYASDMSAYEAYVVDASAVVGDTDMALAGLRWQAAWDRINTMRSLPTDYLEAVATIRDQLVWVVGPAEGARLRNYLETADVE